MVAFQYKSLSFSSLFILIVIPVEYGCGDISKPPLVPSQTGGNAVGAVAGQISNEVSEIPTAGSGGLHGLDSTGDILASESGGSIGGTGGQPAYSGIGGGIGGISAGAASGKVAAVEGTAGSSVCFNAGTDPNRNKVQPENICERLTTIQCAAEACCCDMPVRDFEGCKQGMMMYCREQLKLDTIMSDPVTGFDPIFAEKAFGEFEAMSSRCDIDVVFWGFSLQGLRGFVKGTIEPGQSCAPKSTLGKSLDETGAAALASCKDPANTACWHPSILQWVCAPRVDVGGKCITDINCLEGLYCDNPDLILSGASCRPRKNLGEPCAFPNECQSLICKGGWCAEVNKQNVYCVSE